MLSMCCCFLNGCPSILNPVVDIHHSHSPGCFKEDASPTRLEGLSGRCCWSPLASPSILGVWPPGLLAIAWLCNLESGGWESCEKSPLGPLLAWALLGPCLSCAGAQLHLALPILTLDGQCNVPAWPWPVPVALHGHSKAVPDPGDHPWTCWAPPPLPSAFAALPAQRQVTSTTTENNVCVF